MPKPYRSTTHLTSLHHGLLVTVALAFACPSDDTTPSDGSDSAGTTTAAASTSAATGVTSTSSAPGSSTAATDPTAADSSGDAPPELACICTLPNELGPSCNAEALAAWVPDCPEVQPCPRLTVECSRPGFDLYDCTSELAFDEAAMQCMLEVLRDGTPARLEIDGLMDNGAFSGQSLYLVHVLGPQETASDRLALRTGCMPLDLGAEPYGPTPHELADPGYFTGCMDMASPSERYECMMDGLGTELPCEIA